MEVEQITATNTEERPKDRLRGSAPVSGYDYWLNDDDDKITPASPLQGGEGGGASGAGGAADPRFAPRNAGRRFAFPPAGEGAEAAEGERSVPIGALRRKRRERERERGFWGRPVRGREGWRGLTWAWREACLLMRLVLPKAGRRMEVSTRLG